MTSPIAPVIRTVDVGAPIEQAFAVFTERIGEWWPLEEHGNFGDRAESCTLEPRVGGRLYETSIDGEEAHWAEVIAFEPPQRIVLAWQPNPDRPAATEVEFTFTPQVNGTRVELIHRGWELLGDEGVEARESYDQGWPVTLAQYAETVASR